MREFKTLVEEFNLQLDMGILFCGKTGECLRGPIKAEERGRGGVGGACVGGGVVEVEF